MFLALRSVNIFMKFILFTFLLSFVFTATAGTCVSASGGFVVITNETVEECTSLVILSKDEYISSSSFTDLFTMTEEQYQDLAGAFLILLCLSLSIKIIMRQLMPK